MRRARSLFRLVVATLLTMQASCGVYSFSGTSLPGHIRTIAVPIFENKTPEYAVADEITEAITQRFLQDGRLKLTGEGRADCVVEGTVVGYEHKVQNYSAAQMPEDYIVVVRVAVVLRDAVKNREIWRADAMVVSAVYSVVSGSEGALKDEAGARQKAIRELAEDLLARTMEQW